jgi:hypothetical protein
LLGEIPLNAVNLEAVQRMASALIQGRNGKPGITPDTVWNICGTLLSVFKFAKLWGYPVCEFKRKGPAMPDYNPPEVKPFTVEEALRIFAASGPFYGVLFTTQAALALRPGEVISLFVDDFDFERGTVLIQRNADLKELVTTKGGQRGVSAALPAAKVGLVCGCKFQQRCSRIDSFHNKSLRAARMPVINFGANRSFMFF